MIICFDIPFTRKPNIHNPSFGTHSHTHLWFDGAVDGWGAGGLHATAAEGLGAGREGGVGDAVGHFVLQRWGALSVQLRSILHLGRVTHTTITHSHALTQHNLPPRSTQWGFRSTRRPPPCNPTSHQTIMFFSHCVLYFPLSVNLFLLFMTHDKTVALRNSVEVLDVTCNLPPDNYTV